MAMLSVAPKSPDDERLGAFVDDFRRRVDSTPLGVCPLVVTLTALETAAGQTCGKCVPCRDGIPHLVELMRTLVDCDADASVVDEMRELSQLVRDTSDCAIGYHAADQLLAALDAFSAEVESHLERHACTAGIGQTVPCETGCPAHVNVPGYIALVAAGDNAGAVAMVRKDNPFPTACGLVCEHPCEAKCRRRLIDDAINIRGIKKYATDQAPADRVPVPRRSPDTGCRIAVIGGGPAGMTCAYFASLMGHRVTVFERRSKLGGMMRYGIPAYRFPRERLDEDLRAILSVGGIEVKYGAEIGTEEFEALRRDYDAVFVAIGAHTGRTLSIDNIDADGVVPAVQLLGDIGDGAVPDMTGKRVVVIGGGNVAMDCSRTALRAGAREVSIVYRRRQEDMTALQSEVLSAVAEGVEMVTLEAPAAIEVDDAGHCTALLTQPQMTGPIRNGRPSPVALDVPQHRIPADLILVAVGQDIVSGPFNAAGMPTNRNRFVADDALRVPDMPGVYAGGDCQTGPKTVIKAIGAGKVAARNIDEYLGYHHTLPFDIAVPAPHPNDRTPVGRVNIAERPARERRCDFAGVEIGMSAQEARQECARCLRCDVYGIGSAEGGRVQYE